MARRIGGGGRLPFPKAKYSLLETELFADKENVMGITN